MSLIPTREEEAEARGHNAGMEFAEKLGAIKDRRIAQLTAELAEARAELDGERSHHQQTKDALFTAMQDRAIAEGTSVVVPVKPNKATLERIALAMLTHEWNGSPPQAEVDQLSEYWIPAALFAYRAIIATTPARTRGGR